MRLKRTWSRLVIIGLALWLALAAIGRATEPDGLADQIQRLATARTSGRCGSASR